MINARQIIQKSKQYMSNMLCFGVSARDGVLKHACDSLNLLNFTNAQTQRIFMSFLCLATERGRPLDLTRSSFGGVTERGRPLDQALRTWRGDNREMAGRRLLWQVA